MTRADHVTLRARDLKRLFDSFLVDDGNGVGPRCTVYVDDFGAHCVEAPPEEVEARLHTVDRLVAAMAVKPFLARAREADAWVRIACAQRHGGTGAGLSFLSPETGR